MKFIHCADLHLDSKMEGLPSEKSKIRREEIVRSFERLAEFATINEVSAVIISGDMFDTEKVLSKTKARVIFAIKSNPKVDFIYLSGNHDLDNFISSLDDLPENLKVIDKTWTKFIYGETVISGIVFDSKNADFIYDGLKLNEKDVNIVALHGQIAGYKSNEKAEIISLPLLKDKFIDYLALGHIHQYSESKLDLRGKYVYSGCLDGRGFDEIGEKGFVLINVEDGKLSSEFVPFSSRVFYEKTYSVEGEPEWLSFRDKIISDLTSIAKKDDLIKVIITGDRTSKLDIDFDGLSARLNEIFFFVKVYDKTLLSLNEKDFENDKSVRGEFVRLVLNSDLQKEKKDAIIMCGLNALKGEDL